MDTTGSIKMKADREEEKLKFLDIWEDDIAVI